MIFSCRPQAAAALGTAFSFLLFFFFSFPPSFTPISSVALSYGQHIVNITDSLWPPGPLLRQRRTEQHVQPCSSLCSASNFGPVRIGKQGSVRIIGGSFETVKRLTLDVYVCLGKKYYVEFGFAVILSFHCRHQLNKSIQFE